MPARGQRPISFAHYSVSSSPPTSWFRCHSTSATPPYDLIGHPFTPSCSPPPLFSAHATSSKAPLRCSRRCRSLPPSSTLPGQPPHRRQQHQSPPQAPIAREARSSWAGSPFARKRRHDVTRTALPYIVRELVLIARSSSHARRPPASPAPSSALTAACLPAHTHHGTRLSNKQSRQSIACAHHQTFRYHRPRGRSRAFISPSTSTLTPHCAVAVVIKQCRRPTRSAPTTMERLRSSPWPN